MEVILREEIEKLGNRGDVVKVAPGYARNFLIPRKLAVHATEANKKIIAQEREAWLRREAVLKSESEQLATLLAGVKLTFTHKAGESDQLFGSVTTKDIADALAQQSFTIDRKKIALEHPIKTLGNHTVDIRLHREVTVKVPVSVLREGGEPAAAAGQAPAAEASAAESPAETEE